MKLLTGIQDFNELVNKCKSQQKAQENKIRVIVHLGTCGISSGASKVLDAFQHEIEAQCLKDVIVSKGACIGRCDREPTVTVRHPALGKVIYCNLEETMIPRIIQEHIIGSRPIKEWTLDQDSPLLKLQEIRVMHNQDLDPMSIEQYMARDGYRALAKALTRMKPDEVIAEVKKAGLRGRGGAGFNTATKWGFVRSAAGKEKFVVCNGDEGDPGAYMNRAVLEGNPHSIIEGMAIGAYAIGDVRQGYAYIRAEYPLAIETLSHAIAQAHEYGLLGKNILGAGFDFSLDIFPGAGAFVCGEETALLISIEGKRGNPRQRPPFPANQGLFGKPTTLNNVETWSNVPRIILEGADWFSSVGSEKSRGTKTFCLVGKVNNTGLIETPLGTPMGKIVFDLGGGIPDGKKFKAVQIGGPSGGVIPAQHLNTPVDYESINSLGAIMGSGGIVVMDEDSCMVDVARFFLRFSKDESCGKCLPCRAGTARMLDILEKIVAGKGTVEDLDVLSELGEMVSSTSLCGLGQTSPNPVLTTLRYFRDEYLAHIIDKKCPAAVCQTLFKSPCQHVCPVGLNIPGYISLIKEGKYAESYHLIKQHNPFPMVCGRICHHPCEGKCRRAQVDEPMAIRELKRFAADYAQQQGIEHLPPKGQKKSERIAVIGAGPAGLSAAHDLAWDSYPVTVFEALSVAGGLMAVAIPEYRLPRESLNYEIGQIQKMGVEVRLNTRVNDIEELFKNGFKAVFIATGAHKGEKMNIPGEDLSGVYDAIKFLRELRLEQPLEVGQRVVVIGGGNSAIDSARVALRKGAKKVHLLYRREKQDMPALAEEIEAAEKENIEFHFLANPTRIMGDNGKVTGIEYQQMELREFDRSGRKTPYPVSGSEHIIEVETVIEAVGQKPDTSFIRDGQLQLGKTGIVLVDPRTMATGRAGVFAGGDVATGPQTVIEAIAAGKKAASSIKKFFEGREPSTLEAIDERIKIEVSSNLPAEEDTEEHPRIKAEEISLSERMTSFKEIVRTFSEEQARSEAARCLRCDLGLENSDVQNND